MKKEKAPRKERKKKKTGRKVLLGILIVLVLFFGVTAVISVIGNKQNAAKIASIPAVTYENQLVPQQDENGNWRFTTDRELKVLQLTDVHIGGGWLSTKKDAMALNAVAAMVTAEKPDLVVVTGDVGYPVPFQAGTLNNKASAKLFADLMEKLGVYWTVCFGNHDTEAYSYYSREKISDFYSGDAFSYCLYQAGPEEIAGFGNQIIHVQDSRGVLTQAIYLFDSHSYTDGDWFGIFWKYDNIHQDQVDWYKKNVLADNAANAATFKSLGLTGDSTVKSALFFHIPLVEYRDAWVEYVENGFKDTENVKLYYGTAGESKRVLYPGIGEDTLFETAQELGSTKAIFCGHDHLNNFSLDYKGIRLTYGMSIDYLAYIGIYQQGTQRGCTVITFAPDGSFDCKPENYYQDKYAAPFEKEPVTMQEIVPLDEIPLD